MVENYRLMRQLMKEHVEARESQALQLVDDVYENRTKIADTEKSKVLRLLE